MLLKAPQNLDQMSCLEAGKDPDELPAKKNSVLKVTQDSWETTANSLEISVNSMPAVVNGMEKMLPCKETIRVMNTVVYNLETSINKEEIKVNGPEESVSCLETYTITNGLTGGFSKGTKKRVIFESEKSRLRDILLKDETIFLP